MGVEEALVDIYFALPSAFDDTPFLRKIELGWVLRGSAEELLILQERLFLAH